MRVARRSGLVSRELYVGEVGKTESSKKRTIFYPSYYGYIGHNKFADKEGSGRVKIRQQYGKDKATAKKVKGDG